MEFQNKFHERLKVKHQNYKIERRIDEGDVLGARGIQVRERERLDWRWTAFVHYDVWLNISTGVSTVRIHLRRSIPLLAWWCAILVLGHSSVTVRSSESGASYHYWNCSGTKKKKNKSRGRLQDFIFQKLKSEQVLNTKKREDVQTSNKRVFANNYCGQSNLISYPWNVRRGFMKQSFYLFL